jgi:hypothetical protein
MKNLKNLLSASKAQSLSNVQVLSSSQLKTLIGGLTEAPAASGSTSTSSGQQCDGTAVCNCKCPKEQ